MATCPQCKAEMQTDGVTNWCVQADCPTNDDHSDRDDECFVCGGSGELDECECSEFEDTCCCLHPTPRACPECVERERDIAMAKRAAKEQTVTLDELKAELAKSR